MRSLWQRFIQSIFGESYSLQGQWLGGEKQLEECDCFPDFAYCEDLSCMDEDDDDTF